MVIMRDPFVIRIGPEMHASMTIGSHSMKSTEQTKYPFPRQRAPFERLPRVLRAPAVPSAHPHVLQRPPNLLGLPAQDGGEGVSRVQGGLCQESANEEQVRGETRRGFAQERISLVA